MTAETEDLKPKDAPTEDTPAEPERPDWLPKQFLTPEALAKSYLAAQQKITQQGSQLSEMTADNAALTEELDRTLEDRHALEDRIATLERGLLKRLVSRGAGV